MPGAALCLSQPWPFRTRTENAVGALAYGMVAVQLLSAASFGLADSPGVTTSFEHGTRAPRAAALEALAVAGAVAIMLATLAKLAWLRAGRAQGQSQGSLHAWWEA